MPMQLYSVINPHGKNNNNKVSLVHSKFGATTLWIQISISFIPLCKLLVNFNSIIKGPRGEKETQDIYGWDLSYKE